MINTLKQSYHWHFAFDYLSAIESYTELTDDKIFHKRYFSLMEYVASKITMPKNAECYVVFEKPTHTEKTTEP